MTALERILSETILTSTGCLVNLTRSPSQRYVAVKVDGRLQLGHRLVWQATKGPIPKGKVVHHRCETQRCLNIEHMELKTASAHSKTHAPRRTRCKRHGRAYDRTIARGDKICTLCERERQIRYRAKKRL